MTRRGIPVWPRALSLSQPGADMAVRSADMGMTSGLRRRDLTGSRLRTLASRALQLRHHSAVKSRTTTLPESMASVRADSE